MMLRHLSERRLNRIADEEIKVSGGATRHLAMCARCRNRVSRLRALRSEVRALDRPVPDPELRATVLRRWQAGDRAVLPAADVVHVRSRRHLVAVAAGILLIVAPVATAVWTRSLDAGLVWGRLEFTPARPARGATVSVVYERAERLADQERLVLRARLRRPGDLRYERSPGQLAVTELRRDENGLYRGSFTLPDSVVFAVFAVEDVEGRRVDHNASRLWELMTFADGHEERAALIQRMNDLLGRNWEAAYQTARRAAELFPDDPESWSMLLFFDQEVLGAEGVDSVLAGHRARLDGLTAALSPRDDLPGDEVAAMYWYATGARDSAAAAYWRGRLIAEYPAHPRAVEQRVVDALRSAGSDRARALDGLEALWSEAGPAIRLLPLMGFQTARAVGDEPAVLSWGERLVAMDSSLYRFVAGTYVQFDGLRARALSRLRAQLLAFSVPDDERRRLAVSVDEQARLDAASRSHLYAAIGEALIASGRIEAGADTLALAARTEWDTETLRRLGAARLSLGDTVRALEALAAVAVDPNTKPDRADSIDALAGVVLPAERWTALRGAARGEMYRQVLAGAVDRPVRGRVLLVAPDGSRHDLRDLSAGRVTLVAFWSRYCGPSLESLPALDDIAARLEAREVGFVAVTSEPPSEDLTRFLTKRGLRMPVYHDTRARAMLALDAWGTPAYYVLDDRGRVRFVETDHERLLREVMALEGEGLGSRDTHGQ